MGSDPSPTQQKDNSSLSLANIYDGLTDLDRARLDCNPRTHAFAVVSWGCAATLWLSWALNKHPDIFCVHAANEVWSTFGKSPRLDGAEYLRVIATLGCAHTAAGDVHGVSRHTIPNVRQVFGNGFSAAVVVREPLRRLLSQMAMYDAFKGFHAWHIRDLDSFIENMNIKIPSDDYDSKLFVHGARMLNAICEEVHVGPIYKSEDLTTRIDTLMHLAHHISAGKLRESSAWAEEAIAGGKVNLHASRMGHVDLLDWQKAVLKRCVSKESWDIYDHLGYATPEFI